MSMLRCLQERRIEGLVRSACEAQASLVSNAPMRQRKWAAFSSASRGGLSTSQFPRKPWEKAKDSGRIMSYQSSAVPRCSTIFHNIPWATVILRCWCGATPFGTPCRQWISRFSHSDELDEQSSNVTELLTRGKSTIFEIPRACGEYPGIRMKCHVKTW